MTSLHSTLILTLCLFLLGCGTEKNTLEAPSKQATHLSEAQEYCKLYEPQRWFEMRKTMTFPEMVEQHSKDLESVIKTNEFRQVLSELHHIELFPAGHPEESTNAETLYMYVIDEISKLTHSNFSCPNLKFYYQQLFIDTTTTE